MNTEDQFQEQEESPPYNGFLDSVQGEISMFRAVMRTRPVGIHRHFHMMCIMNHIRKDTGVVVEGRDIWTKLGGMYDLDALEELEVTGYDSSSSDEDAVPHAYRSLSPSQNLVAHPFFRDEFSLYNLPQSMDIETILAKRRQRSTTSTPSPMLDEEQPPTTGRPKKASRKSNAPHAAATPTPSKKEVVSAGLVSGESDSSALTENSEMDIDVEGVASTRRSVTISTPKTILDEEEAMDVGSPALSTASKPSRRSRKKTPLALEKRSRPPKGSTKRKRSGK